MQTSLNSAYPLQSLSLLLLRSLFPLSALMIIIGTLWYGPWVSATIALLWWRLIGRIA